jgi:opacity protein-like surface antigen
MKKFNLSLVAVLAMSTFAIAGGDIAPVEEPVVVVEEPVVTDSGFYLGLAYGLIQADSETTFPGGNLTYDEHSESYSEIMLQAGYKFNSYVAVEGRYWIGMSDNSWSARFDDDYVGVTGEVDTWGLYVKPMYPVTENFDIYALLGYADIDYQIKSAGYTYRGDAVDGFSWGLGADYSFTDSVSVFIDYVSLYDDTWVNADGNNVDDVIDTWNFGVTYQF